MASIKKRPDGVWRARYRDAAGKEHARHFELKKDAQRWLDEVTASKVTGTYVDPRKGRITVEAMAKAWQTNPEWEESTKARNVSILDRHVIPRWGSVKLVDVAHEDIQVWVNELVASGMAGGTVRKVAGVLSGVLAMAVKARRLAANPAAGVNLPKQKKPGKRYLNDVQLENLAEASDEYGDLVLVLGYCGLRIGEAAALRVKHVDMLRRRLRVEESVTEVNGKLVWTTPKDDEARSVPWPAFLVPDMEDRIRGRGPEDLLFPAPRGGALRVRNMRRDWFDLAAEVAGVKGLTPHELRHTAASLAVRAGASVLALQRMLGHDKPSTTLDVYSDLFDEDLDAVADKLDEARTAALADYLRTPKIGATASDSAAGP